MKHQGAIAAGHPLTVEAGYEVLKAGGNAYDAAVAAFFMACVAEPVLASLGGGGFLLSQTKMGQQQLFDFFVQTPRDKKPEAEIDFKPIWADFGTIRQEFHIGQGAIATPGALKGVFEVHRQLGSMPMRDLVQPAIRAAREGMQLNALQAYIFSIVSPILTATDEVAKVFSGNGTGQLIGEGELFRFPQLADTLEVLAIEGDDLFYRGEIAQRIAACCAEGGGHLCQEDLEQYRVLNRQPLQLNYDGCQIITNPPPSSGGILIAFALQLWFKIRDRRMTFGSKHHLELLTQVMEMTNQARIESHVEEGDMHPDAEALLDEELLSRYCKEIKGRSKAHRGTTHISVIDRCKNVATLTVSNGEGCGSMVPGTGIMLNNMLGEEDLNPLGFQQWQQNQRMTSMMAPCVLNQSDQRIVALGSGGSNRIRTAILQTLINLTDFDLSLEDAVCNPRIHFENELLSVENGFDDRVLTSLFGRYPNHKCWDALNLFFGGVHSVQFQAGRFEGVGDPRRGGASQLI